MQLIIDVVLGMGGMFSLANGSGKRFRTRSRSESFFGYFFCKKSNVLLRLTSPGAGGATMTISLKHLADVVVRVGKPISVGETLEGLRRVVPILGGTIRGDRLSGTILPAGADYQLIRPDGYTTLDARYVAQLDDQSLLYIVNLGVRFGPPDIMARITSGEQVAPEDVYFRTTPRFETAAPAHAWLTRPLFLATGARRPDRVELTILQVE